MKKVTLFAAAFAMLAFASCNKEENGVALNFGGENYTSTDKEAYSNNRILFTDGENIIVNGTTYQLTTSSSRNYARVFVTSASEYDVNYGDVTVDPTTGAVTTTFQSVVNLIPMTGTTEMTANHQPWPMSAHVTDPAEQFHLLHNVAIVSPAVKYGSSFATMMWGEGGIDPQGFVYDGTNMPELYFDSIVLMSSNIRLTGTAYLDASTPEDPIMVTGSPINNDKIKCIIDPAYQAVAVTDDELIGHRFGNVAIAPVYVASGSKTLDVTFYFHVNLNGNVHHYSYAGQITINRNQQLQRANRKSLLANFYDQSRTNLEPKITVID